MSYNGSGTFQINTSGQPVVAGTVISSTAFNALTADLATGLSTAITKDGQTTTTARIPFAAGISSTLVTDSSSVSTGSIITAGGVGIAKALYVGTTANVAGAVTLGGVATFSAQPIFSSLTASTAVATDASKGLVSVTNTGTGNNVLGTGPTISLPVIDNIKMGYATTATAAGTTTLTVASNYRQFFTGSTTQTVVLPVTSTLVTGIAYEIENNSTGLLTVNSSGGNLVGTIPAGVCAHAVCIGTTLTTAADWDWDYISTSAITGTGAAVLATSPTLATPILGAASATSITVAAGAAGTPSITTTGDTNTGIFFPAADTIAFTEGGVEAMRIDSSANLQFNSGYGSVATAFGCRAWVNFNGTGTPAIRGSGNVSSITDVNVGRYTINFTNAMPDTNYAVVTGQGDNVAANTVGNTSPISSASSVPFNHYEANTFQDVTQLFLAVFR
jgi:hypothetical protein